MEAIAQGIEEQTGVKIHYVLTGIGIPVELAQWNEKVIPEHVRTALLSDLVAEKARSMISEGRIIFDRDRESYALPFRVHWLDPHSSQFFMEEKDSAGK